MTSKMTYQKDKENDLSKVTKKRTYQKDPASRLIGVLETKRIKIHTL